MKKAGLIDWKRMIATLVASMISGALAGAIAGWSVRDYPSYNGPIVAGAEGASATSSTSSSVQSEITLVSVDPTSAEPIVPPAFAERRNSSVALLYKKGVADSLILEDEQILGQAVSVTSDGWFVAPSEIIGDSSIKVLMLWLDNRAYEISQGVYDARGDVIFLKTNARNAAAPAFARFQDVNKGLSVWMERTAGSFEPMLITETHERVNDIAGSSSDIAGRRITLSDSANRIEAGAPVWSIDGSLVCLMEKAVEDERSSRCIPVSSWAPSLFGIFSDGKILHASLGVRGIDLSSVRLMNRPEWLPERGFWIRSNQANGITGIVQDSPAEIAGLKEGDVILRVDRDILDGRADLGEILVQYKPHSEVVITINREGKQMEIPVQLGSVQVSEAID